MATIANLEEDPPESTATKEPLVVEEGDDPNGVVLHSEGDDGDDDDDDSSEEGEFTFNVPDRMIVDERQRLPPPSPPPPAVVQTEEQQPQQRPSGPPIPEETMSKRKKSIGMSIKKMLWRKGSGEGGPLSSSRENSRGPSPTLGASPSDQVAEGGDDVAEASSAPKIDPVLALPSPDPQTPARPQMRRSVILSPTGTGSPQVSAQLLIDELVAVVTTPVSTARKGGAAPRRSSDEEEQASHDGTRSTAPCYGEDEDRSSNDGEWNAAVGNNVMWITTANSSSLTSSSSTGVSPVSAGTDGVGLGVGIGSAAVPPVGDPTNEGHAGPLDDEDAFLPDDVRTKFMPQAALDGAGEGEAGGVVSVQTSSRPPSTADLVERAGKEMSTALSVAIESRRQSLGLAGRAQERFPDKCDAAPECGNEQSGEGSGGDKDAKATGGTSSGGGESGEGGVEGTGASKTNEASSPTQTQAVEGAGADSPTVSVKSGDNSGSSTSMKVAGGKDAAEINDGSLTETQTDEGAAADPSAESLESGENSANANESNALALLMGLSLSGEYSPSMHAPKYSESELKAKIESALLQAEKERYEAEKEDSRRKKEGEEGDDEGSESVEHLRQELERQSQLEMEQLKMEHEDEMQRMRNQMEEELQRQKREWEGRLQLEEEISGGENSETATLTGKIESLEAELAKTRLSYENKIQKQHEEHASEIDEMLAQLDLVEAEQNERYEELEATAGQKDTIIDAVSAQLSAAKKELSDLRSELESRNEEVDAAKAETATARANAHAIEESMDELMVEHRRSVENEKAKRRTAVEKVKAEMIASAEEQFGKANEVYLTLKAEYEGATERLRLLEREVVDAKAEAETARSERNAREVEMTAEVAQMKAAVAAAEASSFREAQKHAKELETLRDSERELRSKAEEASANCATAHMSLATVVAEKERLSQENKELNSVCEELMAIVEGGGQDGDK